MSQNRRTILSNLTTALGNVTGVTTVVRTITEIDITQYTESQLPLINVREPEENTEDEMTSMKSMMNLEILTTVFFIRWGMDPDSTYETLVKNIRNQIGANFTLNGSCTGTWVTDVSLVTGEMPLFRFDVILRCEYYLDLKST
jgi:thioester reductase-like protein